MCVEGGDSFRVALTTLAQTAAHFKLTYFSFSWVYNACKMLIRFRELLIRCSGRRFSIKIIPVYEMGIVEGELYPLLPQPLIEDKKAWFKLELQSESNPPWCVENRVWLLPASVPFRLVCPAILCCLIIILFALNARRWGVTPVPAHLGCCSAAGSVKVDAKKLLPAPTLGQLGALVTKRTVLINAHCSARARQ